KDDPPLLRAVVPNMPQQLERIVEKSLRKDRDHRYQHVRDLQIDIEDLRDEIKFEAKLASTSPSTIVAAPQPTNRSDLRSTLRSALTTNITEKRRFTLLHAILLVIVFGLIV